MSPRDGALNAHIELPFKTQYKTGAKVRERFLFVCFRIHSLSTTFLFFWNHHPSSPELPHLMVIHQDVKKKSLTYFLPF